MPSKNLDNANLALSIMFSAACNQFNASVYGKKWKIQIACVSRTRTEQLAIFMKGREYKNGVLRIIGTTYTNCDGTLNISKHQIQKDGTSHAIDFFLVNKKTGVADWTTKIGYHIVGRMMEKAGLTWGGRWKQRDLGHVEI